MKKKAKKPLLTITKGNLVFSRKLRKFLVGKVCEDCEMYCPEEPFYKWQCPSCHTLYNAQKYRKGNKEWFEYRPVETIEPASYMGVSQWLEYGKKYGYYDYFKKLVKKEKLNV